MKHLRQAIIKRINGEVMLTTFEAEQCVLEYDDQAGMLTAFRHAANSIGVETGVMGGHVDHDEALKSVAGNCYFVELITEAEHRFKRLSLRYERLRAASSHVVDGLVDGKLQHHQVVTLNEALTDDHNT